jgi:acyl carrier protein
MTAPARIDEFVRYLAAAIGVPDVLLDHDQPFVSLVIGDSLMLTELAIVLEQELGMDLPDDLDLRYASFSSLYARYSERSHHA